MDDPAKRHCTSCGTEGIVLTGQEFAADPAADKTQCPACLDEGSLVDGPAPTPSPEATS